MRIQHNIMAMNAYRNYNNNNKALSGNLEKLSSGYKINRAGDDAAGLAISEKMRAQITGLNAAQKNVKDGISLVKTAEGAMQEIQDMLNRMDYLATQSANGTYDNEVDRLNLQKEVEALQTEIDRIAESANFNGIKLLDGSLEKGKQLSSATVNDGIIKGSDRILQTVYGEEGSTVKSVYEAPGTETILDGSGATQKASFSVDLKTLNISAGESVIAADEASVTEGVAGVKASAAFALDNLADGSTVTVDGTDYTYNKTAGTLTAADGTNILDGNAFTATDGKDYKAALSGTTLTITADAEGPDSDASALAVSYSTPNAAPKTGTDVAGADAVAGVKNKYTTGAFSVGTATADETVTAKVTYKDADGTNKTLTASYKLVAADTDEAAVATGLKDALTAAFKDANLAITVGGDENGITFETNAAGKVGTDVAGVVGFSITAAGTDTAFTEAAGGGIATTDVGVAAVTAAKNTATYDLSGIGAGSTVTIGGTTLYYNEADNGLYQEAAFTNAVTTVTGESDGQTYNITINAATKELKIEANAADDDHVDAGAFNVSFSKAATATASNVTAGVTGVASVASFDLSGVDVTAGPAKVTIGGKEYTWDGTDLKDDTGANMGTNAGDVVDGFTAALNNGVLTLTEDGTTGKQASEVKVATSTSDGKFSLTIGKESDTASQKKLEVDLGKVSDPEDMAKVAEEIAKIDGGKVQINGVDWEVKNDGTVLTFTQVNDPTKAVEEQANFDVMVGMTSESGSTVMTGSIASGTTVLQQGVSSEAAAKANTVFKMFDTDIQDGMEITVGDKKVTLAVGADSKAEGAIVVDLKDMEAGKITAEQLSTALGRISVAIGDEVNGEDSTTFRVGVSDTDGDGLADGLTVQRNDDLDTQVYTSLDKLAGLFQLDAVDVTTGEDKVSKGLTLQIGDTSDGFNQMTVDVGDMHVAAMKYTDEETGEETSIADIDISSQEGAQKAVDVIKNAINYVSSVRGDLGAIQNRLDHTANNLSVMAENIQDAESTIRDTDVAEEMMSYVKNNILVQSAQAMLAQANQVPQGVLQLLG